MVRQFFRVTLNDYAQMFVTKATYEDDMAQFAFIFSTMIKCEEWRECDMKKNICCFVWHLLQCKSNKVEINQLLIDFNWSLTSQVKTIQQKKKLLWKNFRSGCLRVFFKTVVLKSFIRILGKQQRCSLFNKAAGLKQIFYRRDCFNNLLELSVLFGRYK